MSVESVDDAWACEFFSDGGEFASGVGGILEVPCEGVDHRAAVFGASGVDDDVGGFVEDDECTPAGFALYFFNFSTWLGKFGLFLEDLYVSPEYRGSGAGKALLKHLAQLAVEKGCGRFEWNVLDWNEPAIEFYESFAAESQSEWVGYRLTGDTLARFAASD